MILLFANNAKTTLADPLTSISTTLTVSPTTGSEFPNPVAGQYFVITLTDAATGLINEIMWCTARSGDNLTVIRGREGTAAKSWLINDYVSAFPTAGTMADLVQVDQLQNRTYDSATAAGTPNALTASVPSNLTSLPEGFALLVNAIAANTGAATIQLTLTSLTGGSPTVLSALPIVKNGNQALIGGEIAGNGYPCELTYSNVYNAFVLTNPFITTTGLVTINQLQEQFYTYGTASGGSDAIAVTVQAGLTSLVDGATIIFKALYNNATTNPTLTVTYGATTLATKPIVKNNNKPLNANDIAGTGYPTVVVYSSLFDAWVLQNPSIPGSFPSVLSSGGWQKLPSGLIIQWALFTMSGPSSAFTYPISFPNQVLGVIANAEYFAFAEPYFISMSTGAGGNSFSNMTAWNLSTGSYVTTSAWVLAIGY